jgi:ATP sulfurylase
LIIPEILCTLGPASMNERVIARLEHLGVSLFRVNLSHTKIEDLESVVRFIQAHSTVPVCLDTEGAQVRTTGLVDGQVALRENTMVTLHSRLVPGDPYNVAFYPPYTLASLEPGDFISIDFNAVLTQVVEAYGDRAVARVVNGGIVGSNKAVTVHRPISMPALTDKDKAAIAIGRGLGIRHVALSFANRPEDVDEIRALAGDVFVISKIECRNGLDHLESIAVKSDAVLIDRGDLSREIPIERIPSAQKYIIRTAKRLKRKVYVATNLLETMVSAPTPTRAEVNDIFNTLADGADGLVLAAETAIGKFPINCATMVVKLVREFQTGDSGAPASEPFSLLPDAHGGSLHLSEADGSDRAGITNLPVLTVPETVLRDAEQVALGVYSPLSGFMDRETLESVLGHNSLPGGVAWTLPIIMQAPEGAKVAKGQRVVLASEAGRPHALLDITETFSVDIETLAQRWFGTDSTDHPGVVRLRQGGNTLVAGTVKLIERLPSPYRAYELTPQQCRFIFAQKGWTRVIGFHSRNVPHRAHEHIQLAGLEQTHADGLFISPVVGPRKSGDFMPDAIIKGYETLLEFGVYPKDRAVLGCFASYPRYSGPREAVFTALCRKNMGCSHFIIGRDHTGVGNFYGADGNRRLFDELGQIGIDPVFFDPIGFDAENNRYVSTVTLPTALTISGTEVRQALTSGRPLPDWAIRPIVQDILRSELALGRELFCP